MLTTKEAIAMAENQVAEAEIRITRQMIVVARLGAIGQDTAVAEAILEEMKDTLEQAYKHLDRVRARADMRQ